MTFSLRGELLCLGTSASLLVVWSEEPNLETWDRVSRSCTHVCGEKPFPPHFAVFVWFFLMFSCEGHKQHQQWSTDQEPRSGHCSWDHPAKSASTDILNHWQHKARTLDQNQDTTSSWRRTPRNLVLPWSVTWSSRPKRSWKNVWNWKQFAPQISWRLPRLKAINCPLKKSAESSDVFGAFDARNANQRNSVAVSISNRPIRMWCHSRSTGPFDSMLFKKWNVVPGGYRVKKSWSIGLDRDFSFWLIFIPCYMWFFAV